MAQSPKSPKAADKFRMFVVKSKSGFLRKFSWGDRESHYVPNLQHARKWKTEKGAAGYIGKIQPDLSLDNHAHFMLNGLPSALRAFEGVKFEIKEIVVTMKEK